MTNNRGICAWGPVCSVTLITVKGAAACRRRCASVVIPLVTDGAILQARATMARVN